MLNDYRQDLQINISLDFDPTGLINMSRDQIERMDETEAIAISSQLVRYALYLQLQENRERARTTWCDSQIQSLAGSRWDDFDRFMPKEIKIAKISTETPSIVKLNEIKQIASARASELFGISQLIKYYASILFEKGKKNGWNRRDS